MHTYTRGFTIFFASLVAALALAVGVAIYDITVRELALSVIETQSQEAIYAADSGTECALYWDTKVSTSTNTTGSAFATSSTDTEIAKSGQALCNGQDIVAGSAPLSVPWSIVSNGSAATTTFEISLGKYQSSPCVLVTVAKSGNPSATAINAYSHNPCNPNDPNQLERQLQVTY